MNRLAIVWLRLRLVGLMIALFICEQRLGAQSVYKNSRAALADRVKDLLGSLSLEEKISLLGHESPAIQRAGITEYNWWNEALHGVARAGEATVFPQAIGMAATFNEELVFAQGAAVSTEARAKYNVAMAVGNHAQYLGLTFWSPNINIFRDPRWGRGPETYGEDPFLTGAIGTAYVKGLQGNDPHYLKVAACAKHFAVHSGPESERSHFNAVTDEKDLRETYLYAFSKLVKAGVESVMCAYNNINGEPCCTNTGLLRNILRNEWHFFGHIVTDCGALNNILANHEFKSAPEVAAAAMKAGVDLECGNILQKDVLAAVNQHLLSEAVVDSALVATMNTRFKLGMFDDPAMVPYNHYGADSIHQSTHIALSRKLAQESMVLLKNNGILPLQRNKYSSIMVVGANASSLDVLMGSYHGISGDMVTFAEGIAKAAGPTLAIQYDQGYDNKDTMNFGGIWAAGLSDLTIAVMGLTPVLEGEQGDAFLSPSGGDRKTLSLPAAQLIYLKKLRESTKKPVVVVITAGSAIDLKEIEPYADAVLLAWYPGEQGGNALADILFGTVSPSGHLPITFYQSLEQIPDYKDYAMKNRTYRYFSGTVQYPFGFGLSYSQFNYEWETAPAEKYKMGDTIRCALAVKNTGKFDANELVQLYIQYPNLPRMPLRELKTFKKVFIEKGNGESVHLSIPVDELKKWDLEKRRWELYKGDYTLLIGKNANETILSKKFSIR
jgi:beta-glucosidase